MSNRKLTWETVCSIRAAKGDDNQIARQFGVSYSSVYKIRTYRLWKTKEPLRNRRVKRGDAEVCEN